MKTRQVNLRLEPSLIATIESAANAENLERGSMIRKLLIEGLGEWKLRYALSRYQAGEISIGVACQESGRSHWELIEMFRARGIMTPVDVEATIENARIAMRRMGERVAEPSPGYATALETVGGAGSTQSGPVASQREQRAHPFEGSLPDYSPEPGGILLVGINPAPISVARGHYYQGKIGRRLWKRLEALGLLRDPVPGHEDEAFVRVRHGLTDLVKRPTVSAAELSADELRAGVSRLRQVVADWKPSLILFAFKQAAAMAIEKRDVKPGLCGEIAGVPAFLLSGPYASGEDRQRNDDELRKLL